MTKSWKYRNIYLTAKRKAKSRVCHVNKAALKQQLNE